MTIPLTNPLPSTIIQKLLSLRKMEKFTKKELFILVLLVLLGAFLRVYKLDAFPAGFHGDEAWTGIEARRILENGFIGFWSPAALGQTALPMYWTAMIFRLLGESIFTARFSIVLFGVFSIPFFYLFTKAILSSKIATIATFFFVVDSTSLVLSRRADYVAANISFFPAIFFLFMAYKTNKTIYYLITGILLGLLNHSYAALWVTSVLFILLWISLLTAHREKITSQRMKNTLLLILTYLVISSPILSFAVKHNNDFFSRSRMISIFSEQGINHVRTYLSSEIGPLGIILHNFGATLLMFNFVGDRDLWNSFTDKPVFNPTMGIFFLAGFLLGLYKYRHKWQTLIFLYLPFFFFLSGSIFTIDAPNIRRSQISIYFAYIFCGIGVVVLYDFILKKTVYFKKSLRLIGILVILFVGFYRAWTYFSNISISKETKNILCYPLVKISEFVKILPKDTYVYFYSNHWSYHYETLRFLLNNYKGEDRSSQFGKYSLSKNFERTNNVYIFLPEYSNNIEEVEKLYPKGKTEIHKDTDGSLIFTSYFTSAAPVNEQSN